MREDHNATPTLRIQMARKPRPLSSFLGGSSTLESLVAEAHRHGRLLEQVHACLPATMRLHCRHCLIRGRTLVLLVDSPGSATLLRFQLPALLDQLRAREGLPIQDIRLRNLQAVRDITDNRRRLPRVGRAVPESIRQAAIGRETSEIGAALLRLSRTLAQVERQGSGQTGFPQRGRGTGDTS